MNGRKLRKQLLNKNKGTLERMAEDGHTFVSLKQMSSAGRLTKCPCDTFVLLSVQGTYCLAFRVPGGWLLQGMGYLSEKNDPGLGRRNSAQDYWYFRCLFSYVRTKC